MGDKKNNKYDESNNEINVMLLFKRKRKGKPETFCLWKEWGKNKTITEFGLSAGFLSYLFFVVKGKTNEGNSRSPLNSNYVEFVKLGTENVDKFEQTRISYDRAQ